MQAAMETVRDATEGRLDILFNNAGIAPGGLLESQDTTTIRAILDVNVLGVIFSIRAALPMLKATPNALCIGTSSSVATYGHATRSVYSASKFAVKGLTEALSLELEGDDIRVADVLPGCIDTPLLRELAKGAANLSLSRCWNGCRNRVLIGCFLTLQSPTRCGMHTRTLTRFISMCLKKSTPIRSRLMIFRLRRRDPGFLFQPRWQAD